MDASSVRRCQSETDGRGVHPTSMNFSDVEFGMLTLFGRQPKKSPFCDGVSRRTFLQIGGLGMGGLSLPNLLRAEAGAGIPKSHKSVIMIYLCGGPPHQDMYDI